MAVSVDRRLNPTSIRNFGRERAQIVTPDLTKIQTKSYDAFLQLDLESDKRKDQGIESVLREIFPIESYDKSHMLEYVGYELDKPRYTPEECRQLRLTYGRPFRVKLRLNKDEPIEEPVDEAKPSEDEEESMPTGKEDEGSRKPKKEKTPKEEVKPKEKEPLKYPKVPRKSEEEKTPEEKQRRKPQRPKEESPKEKINLKSHKFEPLPQEEEDENTSNAKPSKPIVDKTMKKVPMKKAKDASNA